MSTSPNYTPTTNACKLCTPLGASLAFKGIEGCVPFLHGSQGCATYMRRYVISHFREPVDIASSALGEKQAVFGGGPNLKKGILNVMNKYGAKVVGVATTCLTETIGDDVPTILAEFKAEFGDLPLPEIVSVSTPSFSGTHMDGWHDAMRAVAETLVTEKAESGRFVNLMPGFVSCADVRILKDFVRCFGLEPVMLPDISDTLDGPALEDYERLPSGGTPLSAIRSMSGALASLELGATLPNRKTAGDSLADRFGVPFFKAPMPMGIRGTDKLVAALEEVSGQKAPARLMGERGRLVDALVDAHKYVFGAKVAVYGEEDLVVGLVSLLAEIGAQPVLAATGGTSKGFAAAVKAACEDMGVTPPEIHKGADFKDIAHRVREIKPEMLMGHSKGYRLAREMGIDLVRVGFPIHDRFGGQRIQTLGYQGTQILFDRIINAILSRRQDECPVGYGYL